MIKSTLIALSLLLTAPASAEEVTPECVTQEYIETRLQELNGYVDPAPIEILDIGQIQSFIAYVTEALGPPPGDPRKVTRIVSYDLKDGTFATLFFDSLGCSVINGKFSIDFLMGWEAPEPA